MKEITQHLKEQGWAVINWTDPSLIYSARESLQKQLTSFIGRSLPLEKYHEEIHDDARHTELQVKLTQYFREQKFGPSIIRAHAEFFKRLIGEDLCVQANPYLRMTRPMKKQDNIGYHRDTFYGGSPYELSILIPFVDVEKESSLSVLSGSHILSENLFPTQKIDNPDKEVFKGSAKHQLGFLYAPKLMDPSIEEAMQPIPLKLGQALLFFLSTVHGSVVNTGKHTRWSTDIRVMHGLAPVDLSARPTYYEEMCSSTITTCAKKYHAANAAELASV